MGFKKLQLQSTFSNLHEQRILQRMLIFQHQLNFTSTIYAKKWSTSACLSMPYFKGHIEYHIKSKLLTLLIKIHIFIPHLKNQSFQKMTKKNE